MIKSDSIGDSLSVQLSSMGRGVFKLTVKFQFPNT
jgi:hypothetical protein